jgi:hypothetical protein
MPAPFFVLLEGSLPLPLFFPSFVIPKGNLRLPLLFPFFVIPEGNPRLPFLSPSTRLSGHPMHWPNYLAAFFAGAFLANLIPHLVHGISGDPFPTPFAKPPGKGLSSPLVNTLWALLNLVVGFFLFRAARLTTPDTVSLLLFLAGITAMAVMLSIHFQSKHKA